MLSTRTRFSSWESTVLCWGWCYTLPPKNWRTFPNENCGQWPWSRGSIHRIPLHNWRKFQAGTVASGHEGKGLYPPNAPNVGSYRSQNSQLNTPPTVPQRPSAPAAAASLVCRSLEKKNRLQVKYGLAINGELYFIIAVHSSEWEWRSIYITLKYVLYGHCPQWMWMKKW